MGMLDDTPLRPVPGGLAAEYCRYYVVKRGREVYEEDAPSSGCPPGPSPGPSPPSAPPSPPSSPQREAESTPAPGEFSLQGTAARLVQRPEGQEAATTEPGLQDVAEQHPALGTAVGAMTLQVAREQHAAASHVTLQGGRTDATVATAGGREATGEEEGAAAGVGSDGARDRAAPQHDATVPPGLERWYQALEDARCQLTQGKAR